MGSAGTILVVDDDPGVREALTTALSARYQMQTAATASAALDALAARRFDLVLLDYRLPDLLGISVLHAIKRFFPTTLVILMTGFGTEEVAIQALRGGARDYIRKPVDFRDLHIRVAALLALRSDETTRPVEADAVRGVPPAPWPLMQSDLQRTMHGRAILKALRHMDAHLDSRLSLAEMARAGGMSQYQFCRLFKTSTGLHFREYLVRRRIAKVKELLMGTGRTMTDTLREVGFKDITQFGRVLKKLEGALPSEFRRRIGDASPGHPPQLHEKNLSS
jgi:YesN/AraC family two-component response regulator